MARPRLALPPFQGLVVLLAGEGMQRALSFAAIWLLTQRLGAEGYAPVHVALAVMMFASLAVEMGFPLFGAREVARDPAAIERLLPRALATQVGAAALLALAAWGAARGGLLGAELSALLPAYSLSLLALPFLVPWVFQGLGRMAWVSVPNVARQSIFLAASALLVRGPRDLARLPWAEVAAVGGAALLAQGAARAAGVRARLDARGAFARELLREALPMGSSQLLWVLRMFLATLCLWTLVPRASVSNYGVAFQVMMVTQALLTMYFTNLYPALARAVQGARAALRRLLLHSIAVAGACCLALALGLAAVAHDLLLAIFGPAFANRESAECLAALAFVLPVLALRGHARLTLLAMGRQRAELLCSLAGTLVLATLIPWWVGARGAAGAAWALLAAEAFGTAATWAALGRELRRSGLPHRIAAGEAGR